MSFRLEFKFHVIQFHSKDVSRKLYLVYILQRNYVWRSKAPTDIESFSERGDIECQEELLYLMSMSQSWVLFNVNVTKLGDIQCQ